MKAKAALNKKDTPKKKPAGTAAATTKTNAASAVARERSKGRGRCMVGPSVESSQII